MLKILRTFIVICILSICHLANAKILTINQLSEILPEIKKSNSSTLLLFDIEDVLIVPLPEYDMHHPYRKLLLSQYKKTLSKQQIDEMLSIVLANRKVKFVDKDTAKIFDYIKKHHIPATILTKCSTKSYGVIANMADFRMNEIKKLGLDFAQLSPFTKDAILPDMVTDGPEKQVKTPIIKAGMIFTSRLNKAKVLEVILKQYNFYPTKIIFIDDKLKNLHALEDLSKKLHIDFVGYEFTGAQNLPKYSIDVQKEESCFHTLREQHVWCYECCGYLNK